MFTIKRNLTDQPDENSLASAVFKMAKNIPKEERMKFCINNHGDYFEHLVK